MRRYIRSLGLVLLGLAASATPALCQSADFDIARVANGVYAVIAKPGIASNGAFIVNVDVGVVDTHHRRLSARHSILPEHQPVFCACVISRVVVGNAKEEISFGPIRAIVKLK